MRLKKTALGLALAMALSTLAATAPPANAVTQDGVVADKSTPASRDAFRQARRALIEDDFSNVQQVGLETIVVADEAEKAFHFYDLSTLRRIKTITPAGKSPTVSVFGYAGRYDAARFAVVLLNDQPSTANKERVRVWNLRVYDATGEFVYERQLTRSVGDDDNRVESFEPNDGYVIYHDSDEGRVAWSWAWRREDIKGRMNEITYWLGNYTRFGSLNTSVIGSGITKYSFQRYGSNAVSWERDYAAKGSNTDSSVVPFTGQDTEGLSVTTKDYLLFRRDMETRDTGESLGQDLLVVNPDNGAIVRTIKILNTKKARRGVDYDGTRIAHDDVVVVQRTGMADAAYDLATGKRLWTARLPGPVIFGVGASIMYANAAPYGALIDARTGKTTYAPSKKSPGELLYQAGGWFFTSDPNKLIRSKGPVRN